MSYHWGPYNIIPSEIIKKYSGTILLREEYDEYLLDKELQELGISGSIVRITNPWYYRKNVIDTWIKIGESDNIRENFAVRWDTANLENGQYQVLGLMHVFIKTGAEKKVIARENIAEVTIEN